jgi:hypothetical protein
MASKSSSKKRRAVTRAAARADQVAESAAFVLPEPRERVPLVSLTPTVPSVAAISQQEVSPILSPVSSIDDIAPDVAATPLQFSPAKSKIEIFHMVEDLQREIVLIRSDHDGKHDHLVNLLDTLLTGQATERVASSTNAVNIQLLAKDHDRLAAQLARESTASFDHLSKIEAFEKKIDTFLLGESSDDTPSEHSIAEIAMPPLIKTEIEPPKMRFIPEPLDPIPIIPLYDLPRLSTTHRSPIYNDGRSSLVPRVVNDTAFSITRSIAPIDPKLSQIELNSLTAKAVYLWGELLKIEQHKHLYETMQWGLYINPTISMQIQAHNSSRGIYTPVILDGTYIDMTNNELMKLILQIVLPDSHEVRIRGDDLTDEAPLAYGELLNSRALLL